MSIERQEPNRLDPLADRKRLTFGQAEGLTPLPSQLKRGEISQEFRAVTWNLLNWTFERATPSHNSQYSVMVPPWSAILRDAHVFHDHRLDAFDTSYRQNIHRVRQIFEKGSWSQVLDWLEFVMKHPSCPKGFAARVNAIMGGCRLAYRVFDEQVISPIGSDAERQAIERAFVVDVAATEFNGARTHLRNAAEQLTAGHYADSVRESIHAVEATARILEPSAALSNALGRLENSAKIHRALKHGFSSLYGYTSDEKGIRHPLLDDGTANVDEADALFMIGACAAFVSYLINKAQKAGILTSQKS